MSEDSLILKSCPFCGSLDTVRIVSYDEREMSYVVLCDCGAQGPWAYNKLQTLKMWNMRNTVSYRPIKLIEDKT